MGCRGFCFAFIGIHALPGHRARSRLFSVDGVCFQWRFDVAVFCHFQIVLGAVVCRHTCYTNFSHQEIQRSRLNGNRTPEGNGAKSEGGR
jgi:hypothetical protein